MTFAELMKQRRVEHRVILRELSEMTGLKVSELADIEHGRRQPPDPETIIKMEGLLGHGLLAAVFLPGAPIEIEFPAKPTVVCLCGSTRFKKQFVAANFMETLAGRIVLSIGCDTHDDEQLFGHLSKDEFRCIKAWLDELHKRKIDLADEVLILNVDGYVGESTAGELAYARERGKRIRWWDPEKAA